MAIKTLFITRNDLQPDYFAKVTDSTGGNVNLTGATIRATMSQTESTVLLINRSTAGVTISDATAGEFQRAWQSGETSAVGDYEIEFEITPASGGKFTVPNPMPSEGVAHVRIIADLDST